MNPKVLFLVILLPYCHSFVLSHVRFPSTQTHCNGKTGCIHSSHRMSKALLCEHHHSKTEHITDIFGVEKKLPLFKLPKEVQGTNKEVHQHLHDLQYRSLKLALLGELVHLYWERVLMYTLARGGTGIEWTDLVQESNVFPSKNLFCRGLLRIKNPETNVDLIPPVYRFIQTYGITISSQPTSIGTLDDLLRDVRSFEFEENDSHKELALNLCDVIDDYKARQALPTEEEVDATLGPLTTMGEMVISVAMRYPTNY